MAVWEQGYGKSFVANVGGVGYCVIDYSGCYREETAARKWEAMVYFAYETAGSPKQSRLIGRGFDTFEEAKMACDTDMRVRAADLLKAANE